MPNILLENAKTCFHTSRYSYPNYGYNVEQKTYIPNWIWTQKSQHDHSIFWEQFDDSL